VNTSKHESAIAKTRARRKSIESGGILEEARSVCPMLVAFPRRFDKEKLHYLDTDFDSRDRGVSLGPLHERFDGLTLCHEMSCVQVFFAWRSLFQALLRAVLIVFRPERTVRI